MKKNIFKTLAATVCFAALVLTGCVNNFEGTTPNRKQKTIEGYYGGGQIAEGLGDSNQYYWNGEYRQRNGFSLSTTSLAAKEDAEITVGINSCKSELDLDSVDKALTFYTLKKNSKNEDFYPEHVDVIPKTLLHTTEPKSFRGSYAFLYRMNTEAITTDKIALVIDATKLKYKNGMPVMNNNGNDKVGEECDSIVKYISVPYKKDGTDTEEINNIYPEMYNYIHTIDELDDTYGELPVSDTDPTPSGKLRFDCSTLVKTIDTAGNITAYEEELGETLSKKFKLQIQKPGTTKWEAGAKMEFAYHKEFSNKPSNPYDAYSYTADVDTSSMEPGTKWRIICDYSVSMGDSPDWVKDLIGHPAITNARQFSDVIYKDIIAYGDKDTTYIYAWGNSGTPGTFNKGDCDYMAAFFTQSDFVNWIETNEHSIEINFKTWLAELVNTDGFILVDSRKTIVPSTTTVHKNGEGKIDKVIITPNNDKLNLKRDSYDVYVGSGTTIKENPDYPKQVQFGCYPDQSMGPLSGYVLLAQNVIKAGTAYATADVWDNADHLYVGLNDYGRSDGNNWNNHFNHNKVYLIAGETYHIQMANGYINENAGSRNPYYNNLMSGSNWKEACYYGELYLYKEGVDYQGSSSSSDYEFKISYNAITDATVEYDCWETGYYYICVNRASYATLNAGHDALYNDAYNVRYNTDVTEWNYDIVRDWYFDAYCNWDGTDIIGTVDFENPYWDSEDNTSPQYVQIVDEPILFYPYWDGTADGAYTGTNYSSHVIVDGSSWQMNNSPRVPYRWGNVYYHIYME